MTWPMPEKKFKWQFTVFFYVELGKNPFLELLIVT